MQSWIEGILSAEISAVSEQELKELIGTEDLLLVQGASKEQLKLLTVARGMSKINFFSL